VIKAARGLTSSKIEAKPVETKEPKSKSKSSKDVKVTFDIDKDLQKFDTTTTQLIKDHKTSDTQDIEQKTL
jgi:hypothetical protein